MKISKARLQQIIKEEVEAHAKRENEDLENDEGSLAGLLEMETEESVEPSEDQLFSKERDPKTGDREKIPPKRNGIKVELKNC